MRNDVPRDNGSLFAKFLKIIDAEIIGRRMDVGIEKSGMQISDQLWINDYLILISQEIYKHD